MIRRPPRSTLFPYTTALPIFGGLDPREGAPAGARFAALAHLVSHLLLAHGRARRHAVHVDVPGADRKSTRLNSSHANISYAVFCLKKKKYIKHLSIL